MGDPFGIAAGVLGVLDIALKIVSKTKNVIDAIRDAPRHIQSVFVQTSLLAAALQSLEFLLTKNNEDAIKDPDGIAEAMRGCKATLQALDNELGDLDVQVAGSRSKKAVAAISWTWKAAAVEKLLNEVERYRSIITLGLTGCMAQDVKYMKGGMSRVEQALSASERRQICDWIKGTNPSPLHEQAVNLHESHTSEWALRTYERILDEIDTEDQPIAHVILIWICGHDRILQAGHRFLLNYFYLSVPALIEHLGTLNANSDRQYDLEDILDICGCLITVVRRDGGSKDAILKLAHYTVLEFLTLDRTRDSKTLAHFAIMDHNISQKYLEPIFDIEGRVESAYFPIDANEVSQDLQTYACSATAFSRCFLQDLIVGNDRLWELQLVCLERIINEHETNQPLHYFARHIYWPLSNHNFIGPRYIMAIPCGSGTTVKEAAVLASLLQADLLEIAERYIEGKDFLSLLQAPLSLWRAKDTESLPLNLEQLQETGSILFVLFSSMLGGEEDPTSWNVRYEFHHTVGNVLQFIARRLLKEGRQDAMARLVHDAARTVEAQVYSADIVRELFKHHNGRYGPWPPEIDCCIRTAKDSSCWFLQTLVSMVADGGDCAYDVLEGYSLLQFAVGYLDCTAARMLLEAGADPNFIDDAGWEIFPSPRVQAYFLETFPAYFMVDDGRTAYQSTLRIVRGIIAWLERQLSCAEPKDLKRFRALTAEGVEYLRRRLETSRQIEELLLQYGAVEY